MAINYSNSDKAKYMSGQYLKEIKLRFPQIGLTLFNDEIYSESLSLEESIFDGNGELSVIGCISNRFSIEIRNQGVSLKNKAIEVQIRIDGGSWNDLFTGYVDSVETVRDRSYQKLQCYDALYQYQDKNFFPKYNTLPSSFTVKTLRDAFFNYLSVSQESTTLVNDAIVLSKNIEDGEIACIDVIRAICQMNGVFGKIDASGIFRYVDLEIPSEFLPYPGDEIFPAQDLFPSEPSQETTYIDKYISVSFEDFELAAISGVVVRDSVSDEEYGQSGTSSNQLLIEGNMWCNTLPSATKTIIAGNILNKVKDAVYQPFEAASIGLPYVNCGDAVAYYVYDYSSGEPITEIMGFTVMTRYLKGIQWMRDTYSARGSQFQPSVRFSFNDNTQNEIEAVKSKVNTKQDKLIAGDGINISGNVISATGGGGIDYSQQEQDTGLLWIDGKPVYQKSINMIIDPTVASHQVSLGQVENIISIDAYIKSQKQADEKNCTIKAIPFYQDSTHMAVVNTLPQAQSPYDVKLNITQYGFTPSSIEPPRTISIIATVRYTKRS